MCARDRGERTRDGGDIGRASLAVGHNVPIGQNKQTAVTRFGSRLEAEKSVLSFEKHNTNNRNTVYTFQNLEAGDGLRVSYMRLRYHIRELT